MTREEAINFGEMWLEINEDCKDSNTYAFFQMAIKALEQQPKAGHWIAEENEEMETVGYYCSECDLPMETEQRTNYCPNCGAKMVKSQRK